MTPTEINARQRRNQQPSFMNAGPAISAADSVELIGVASGIGAPVSGCRFGPETIKRRDIVSVLAERGIRSRWKKILTAPGRCDRSLAQTAAPYFRRIADLIADTVTRSRRFAVIGGDHSNAIGVWSGASSAIQAQGDLGLIWLDAHMDAHTPATSPSGALHGMPLASLLGYGDPALCNIHYQGRKLRPDNVCVVGVRSYEAAEEQRLKHAGVHVFFMEQVERFGFTNILRQAIRKVSQGTAMIGISIDLDVVDPNDAPGVSTPVAGGLCARDLVNGLQMLAGQPNLVGIEIAEFNPWCDREGITANLIRDVMIALFSRPEQLS